MEEIKTDKDEDDLSLDLSKIKNFFKGKPKKETEAKIKSEDEELSIDFSGIKKLFKKYQETKKEDSKVEERNEEELSIDFSKIKSLFKEKELKQKPEEAIEIADLKEALNLRRFFKPEEKSSGKKASSGEQAGTVDEESIQFDFKNIFSVIYKKKETFLPAIFLLIVIGISIHVRMQNADVPITDIWARDSVNNFYIRQLRGAIEQKYPNLPDANKEALINTEYQKLLQEKGNEIAEQTRQTSLFFKSKFHDDNGNLYMPDIDTYYWFRYARNIVEHGYIGDEIRDNKQFDNHILAPQGGDIAHVDTFHPYFLAYFYKIVKLFNSGISLMYAILYYPIIISAITLIPIFYIAKKIGGNLAGFAASLITGINTIFVSKTLFGHADTDAWTVFFPVFVIWFFFLAIESKKLVMLIVFSSLAGLLLGLYNYLWSGWWFVLDFIIFSSIAYIILTLVIYLNKNKSLKGFVKESAIKNLFLSIILLTVFAGVIVTQSEGLKSFIYAPLQPILFTQFKEAITESLWPNVLTTVAELKEGNLPEIISGLGGKPYLLIALVGIILICISEFDNKRLIYLAISVLWYAILLLDNALQINLIIYLALLAAPLILGLILFGEPTKILEIKLATILMMWIISGIYASTKGIRFSLIIASPFGIAFGIAASRFVTYFSRMLNKELHISKVISAVLMIILVSSLYVKPIQASYHTAFTDLPIINDAWYNALTLINTNSSKDAIITSWWDFGHHFKALADRRVTFDGATQAYPQAHWVGSILLNSNEDIAIGILRMLNCGASKAYEELDMTIKDTEKSVFILYQTLDKNVIEAKKILSKAQLEENEINAIVKNTHCNPVENFLIASEDMVSKSGVWGHFGSWDFKRALAYNALKKPEYQNEELGINFLKERLNYSNEEAENLYFEIQNLKSEDVNSWISPWPVYAGILPCRKLDNFTLSCENFIINLTSYDAFIQNPTGIMHPKVAVFPVKNGYIKKEYNTSIAQLQNGRPIGITVIPGEDYFILPADYLLSDSIFTKLFYLDGHGLKNFRKFYEEQTVLGNKIIVWNVDWMGNITKNIFENETNR